MSLLTFLRHLSGDPGTAFYFVISGRVAVVVRSEEDEFGASSERFVNELGAGKTDGVGSKGSASIGEPARPVALSDI